MDLTTRSPISKDYEAHLKGKLFDHMAFGLLSLIWMGICIYVMKQHPLQSLLEAFTDMISMVLPLAIAHSIFKGHWNPLLSTQELMSIILRSTRTHIKNIDSYMDLYLSKDYTNAKKPESLVAVLLSKSGKFLVEKTVNGAVYIAISIDNTLKIMGAPAEIANLIGLGTQASFILGALSLALSRLPLKLQLTMATVSCFVNGAKAIRDAQELRSSVVSEECATPRKDSDGEDVALLYANDEELSRPLLYSPRSLEELVSPFTTPEKKSVEDSVLLCGRPSSPVLGLDS